jgi:hypothetical protein
MGMTDLFVCGCGGCDCRCLAWTPVPSARLPVSVCGCVLVGFRDVALIAVMVNRQGQVGWWVVFTAFGRSTSITAAPNDRLTQASKAAVFMFMVTSPLKRHLCQQRKRGGASHQAIRRDAMIGQVLQELANQSSDLSSTERFRTRNSTYRHTVWFKGLKA